MKITEILKTAFLRTFFKGTDVYSSAHKRLGLISIFLVVFLFFFAGIEIMNGHKEVSLGMTGLAIIGIIIYSKVDKQIEKLRKEREKQDWYEKIEEEAKNV